MDTSDAFAEASGRAETSAPPVGVAAWSDTNVSYELTKHRDVNVIVVHRHRRRGRGLADGDRWREISGRSHSTGHCRANLRAVVVEGRDTGRTDLDAERCIR